MSDAIETLKREIEELRNQLRIRESALAQLESAPSIEIPIERARFAPPMRPNRAAQIYLEELGKAIPQAELIAALVAGGAALGKKRGRHNIRISLEMCVTNGVLIEKNGKLGLPEWAADKF